MVRVPDRFKQQLQQHTGRSWDSFSLSEQEALGFQYHRQQGVITDWPKFLGMAGIVNLTDVNSTRQVLRAMDDYIRDETLKTIEARRARAQQSLKVATQQYMEYADQFRSTLSSGLDQTLAAYKEQQEAERDYLNEQANEEFIQTVKEELPIDELTYNLLRDEVNRKTRLLTPKLTPQEMLEAHKQPGGIREAEKKKRETVRATQEQYAKNFLEIYDSTPALPVRAMNVLYPSIRVAQETGWNKFQNSVAKGWHYFVKWFKETGWKLLVQIGVEVILAFIPGIGQILSTVISMGTSILVDLLDTCKTSAERVALQRAINEGKSRGLDEWDEMFMWRSLIIILMVAIADAEELTIDGNQLKILMATRPDFMNYMQNDEFVRDMWKSEAKMMELLAGEDPTTHEPDFQLYPQNVDECRQAALDMLSDGRMRGFIASIPSDLKKCLK